ncbi:hypothetical protein [Phytohabitans suffuscus]
MEVGPHEQPGRDQHQDRHGQSGGGGQQHQVRAARRGLYGRILASWSDDDRERPADLTGAGSSTPWRAHRRGGV